MQEFLVGGAIRDKILGIATESTEKDYVVVDSSPEEMKSLGFRQVGKEFPVFLHPQSKEEYALARLERKVGKGYKGFEFNTSKSVTLEQDLSRRDLTINAIAQNKDGSGEYIDPFGGLDDIKARKLKHVSEAFTEDPVRILRTARFASRFNHLGFTIDSKTLDLMKMMVSSGEVDALTPERVFKEINLSMNSESPSIFFEVLIESGAYQRLFPMLEMTQAANLKLLDHENLTSEVRLALWLYDQNPSNIGLLCEHLKCPKDIQQIAELVSIWHNFVSDFLSHKPEEILNFYLKTDGLRRQKRFELILDSFKYINIDTSPIVQLKNQLNSIKISDLKNINIAQELAEERLSVISRFIHPAK
ncbi:MAG: polynucleotide adenylyltransferase [Candidatus Thioglobus sp. TMED218]|nr:polynucleotide adenylyltransferase [Candidatus Thioglobus sp.]OUW81677.1 MAG: polynucleotide adenylyltransferase [Candidatus Thioglobus sp. TMED218]